MSGDDASHASVVTVHAAGGVVWRPSKRQSSGGPAPEWIEVAVVHRPKRADWSLPKGHLESGETFLDAAVREVAEETGLACEVGGDLGEVRYVDHRQRPKVVRYWAMRMLTGGFVPNDEVDELRWMDESAALALLTYDSDRIVLGRFFAGHGAR